MPRGLKTLEDLSVEEAELKSERALYKEKKKLNKEFAEEVKQLNIKNFEHEKALLKKYTKERKKAEEELSEYYKEIQSLNLQEYAALHNRGNKDVADEFERLMRAANEKSIKDGIKSGLKKVGLELGANGGLKLNLNATGKIADDVVKVAVNSFTSYQGKINTRLIGYVDESTNAFKQIVDRNTKASGMYRTTEYLANVNTLIEQGIVQNVEQRAFLNTVKDELISTFDATNDTLTRLVRIQQEDSTAARAGMEAYLNRFLNQEFENSEYITDQFKSTSALLEEATALLSAEQATSFEYVVQKWLGALYSEGMSSSGIQALAGAIGQLASGNINQLVGTNIGNLIAMASKGNLATYFKDGLTEATADILMNSIVSYLQELNSSSNNVVKSQLASVFGLSISDLMAASNLNTANVSGNNLSYESARGYTASLLSTAGNRLNFGTMMDNMIENFKFSLGEGIVNSYGNYLLYQAGNLVDALTGGANLGFQLGPLKIESSIGNIIKTASLGISTITNAIDVIFGGAKLTGTMLDTYNSLGGLTKGKVSTWGGGNTGLSESGYVGNANASDILGNSIGGVKDTLSSNRQALTGKSSDEDDIDVVVPNIYKYLINTFDGKLDTLIKLSAINSNYSVVDTLGNNITNSMKTIMGGNSVVVQANAVEKEDLTVTISESVVGIYDILNKVVNGELQLAVRDITTPIGFAMNAGNMAYNTWTGAMR